MTRVSQGCCSVFYNLGTALVLLDAAEGIKFMSLLCLNPYILRSQTPTSMLSSLYLTSARPKLWGKGLAGEGSTRVAGAGGGRTARLGGCRAGPTGNRERGGGAGGGAGGREPKFTTGSCASTTGRSTCDKKCGCLGDRKECQNTGDKVKVKRQDRQGMNGKWEDKRYLLGRGP